MPETQDTALPNEERLRAAIGPRADYYLRHWRKMNAKGKTYDWNWAAGGGYPLLANGQSSAFAPFRLIALPLELGHSLACEAALKLLYLVLNRTEREWKTPAREWAMAKAQFAVLFGERFTRAMAG